MKTIILMAMAVLMTVNVYGQNQMRQGERQLSPQQKERIESQRIAFISSRLQLSPAQAEKFWPLYNAYYAEQQKLRADAKPLTDEEVRNLSENEAKERLQKKLEFRQNELNRDKAFYKEMEAVLSPNQIFILSRVDGDFRRHMLRQARSVSNEKMDNRQMHRMQREQPERRQRQQ